MTERDVKRIRIPDEAMAMRREDAFAYYVREFGLTEAEAREVVAETHSTAFRDLEENDRHVGGE